MRRTCIAVYIVMVFGILPAAAQSVTLKELKVIEGNWSGTYSYPDTAGGKRLAERATARVTTIGRERIVFSFAVAGNTYNDTLLITGEGRYINGMPLVERTPTEDGAVQLVAETRMGEAVQRTSYIFGKNRFQYARLARNSASAVWTSLGEYLFSR